MHENVHDEEYEAFMKGLCAELEEIAREKGKQFRCSIQHVENVKSYAPKVCHYVFDVLCMPVEWSVCSRNKREKDTGGRIERLRVYG